MPKIVDHGERRREIAAAVLRVVVRDGLGGVTLRSVASESGWSTGVLSHYFDNKRALLHGSLKEAARQVGVNLKAIGGRRRPGIEVIQALLEESLPLDARRRALCQIFCYFYGEGVSGGPTAEQLQSYYDTWRLHVREAIVAGQEEGSVRRDIDPALTAESLVAVADGLGLQAVLDPVALPATRQREQVAAWISFLAAPEASAEAAPVRDNQDLGESNRLGSHELIAHE